MAKKANKTNVMILLGLIFSILLGSAALVNAECPSGMVSYWTFDDVDNVEGNPQDTIGSNHGTNNGATIGVSGQVGQALDFDGVDDYVKLDVAALSTIGDGSFTLSAWSKVLEPQSFIRNIIRRDNYNNEGNEGRRIILQLMPSKKAGA